MGSWPIVATLERAEGQDAWTPEHQFTERLARQHKLLRQLRYTGTKPNITHLAGQCRVARKTIFRDLPGLIRRCQIKSEPCPGGHSGDPPSA